MTEARIIKRYANRKLYDTQHSRYVTLEQISEMIRNGDDVKIIDNKTKEDLTSVTLAQIIFEEEKKQRSFLSLQTMRNIIQNGGESLSHLVTEAQKRVTEAQKRVSSILPLRKDDDEPGDDDEPVVEVSASDEIPEPEVSGDVSDDVAMTEPVGNKAMASLREFREWVQQTQQTIDEWQKRVDGRIRDVVEGISPFSGLQKDIKGLGLRIAELEAKLSELAAGEAAGASPGGNPGDTTAGGDSLTGQPPQ